jgi:septal ring factor EnvC (AmiA/AmiB activator)
LKSKAIKKKSFDIIDAFNKYFNFKNQSTGPSNDSNIEAIDEQNPDFNEEMIDSVNDSSQRTINSPQLTTLIEISEESEQRPVTNVRHTPARDKTTDELNEINEKIAKLRKSKEIGLEPENCNKKIKVLTKQKDKVEKKLKKLLKSNQRMQKYRTIKRKKLERLNREHPEVMRNYSLIEEKVGRPRIETGQEGLLETIINIAINGGAAEERRHSEMIRTCKTLSDLNECLVERGIRDRF